MINKVLYRLVGDWIWCFGRCWRGGSWWDRGLGSERLGYGLFLLFFLCFCSGVLDSKAFWWLCTSKSRLLCYCGRGTEWKAISSRINRSKLGKAITFLGYYTSRIVVFENLGWKSSGNRISSTEYLGNLQDRYRSFDRKKGYLHSSTRCTLLLVFSNTKKSEKLKKIVEFYFTCCRGKMGT